MKIGELSQKTGISTSTIRFYEERGLLMPPVRTASGYRDYPDSAVHRLLVVQRTKKLGFSLDAIRGLFSEEGKCSRANTLEQVNVRMREVDMMQASLAEQQRELLVLKKMLTDEEVPFPCPRSEAELVD